MAQNTKLLIALLFFALTSLACVEPDESEPSQPEEDASSDAETEAPSYYDGKADAPTAPSDEEPAKMEEPTEPVPPQTLIKSIRFKRAFKTCDIPECLQDLEFAMSSGAMWRFEHGQRTEMVWLTDEEHATILRLTSSNAFEGAVRRGDFECPARIEDDFNVELVILARDDELGMQSFDVSGCYDTDDTRETPDGFVNFAIELERKYD